MSDDPSLKASLAFAFACTGLAIVISLCSFGALIRHELYAETVALQQIATAQQAIAARQDKPPEINAECHETLALFEDRIKHDLRMRLPEDQRH